MAEKLWGSVTNNIYLGTIGIGIEDDTKKMRFNNALWDYNYFENDTINKGTTKGEREKKRNANERKSHR